MDKARKRSLLINDKIVRSREESSGKGRAHDWICGLEAD